MADPLEYTAEELAKADSYENLGAEYFAAQAAAERFLKHWQSEHAEKLAEAIIKPILDEVKGQVWDAFRDFLLSDTEYNVASEMRAMVEKSVTALIGGKSYAYVKYISPAGYESGHVRETLAKLYADEIKDARIADLEKQLEQAKEDVEWFRR